MWTGFSQSLNDRPGKFDDKWAFPYLEKAIAKGGIGLSNTHVFDRMAEVFPKYPSESFRCLRLFVDRNEDPWFFRVDRKGRGVWRILEQGMKSADPSIREKTDEIINILCSKGYLQYHELVKK